MKKIMLMSLLLSINLCMANDGNTFRKKFERKMAALSGCLHLDKLLAAEMTVYVDEQGKTSVLEWNCAEPAKGNLLKSEIEKMTFSDSLCTGTHKLKLQVSPQGN